MLAEQIANEVAEGGMSFVMDDGKDLIDHLVIVGRHESHDTRTDLDRYVLEDGSAIVVWNDEAWDVERPGQPFTWECGDLPKEGESA